ncbi:MAG TPA: mechanosensitive ion channel family protein [Actinomycetota bacterium]|nr:mechanosensitive ion channel family protein [Actinomycetota bacterium]
MSWDTISGWITDNQATIITTSLKIAGVVVAAFLVTRFLRKAVQRVEKRVSEDTTPIRALQRSQTLAKVLSSAGIVVIWSISIFLILGEVGFKLGPLLAGVGIIGLAIGFGSQNLVRDVVSGFFILFEDQYGVGDVVQINEVATGKVEQLTLRITGLRDLDGTMHYIANGEIVHVANRTKDWARAVIDVGVGYGEDPSKVRAVLERVAEEAKADEELGRNIFATPDVLGVENLGEYEVIWRMLAETKPARQWEVSRALRERVKVAFDEDGIEIPFPYRVMISADGR